MKSKNKGNRAIVLVAILLVATAIAYGYLVEKPGDIKNVKVESIQSEIFTEDEYQAAVDEALDYFKRNFTGCKMTEIHYQGDDSFDAMEDWASDFKVEKVIVLESTFEVGPEGGDGSLEPGQTYTHWQWIIEKDKDGKWKHRDHGYG